MPGLASQEALGQEGSLRGEFFFLFLGHIKSNIKVTICRLLPFLKALHSKLLTAISTLFLPFVLPRVDLSLTLQLLFDFF